MSDSVSDSENERSSQYDAPPPEKRITFDSRAQENNAGPSKIPVARAMRIPCVTQSSGDSNQNDGNTQEIGDIVIEAHGQHNSENRNERTIIPVRIAGGKEGRRERKRKYREKRCAMTIHKSQGGTYDEIVYEYNKTHSIQILYVALSRVTSIEGLYICTRNDDLKFYHGRRTDPSVLSLQQEFQRLSLNRLTTLQRFVADFIMSREGMSIFTVNCQSLRKHAPDLQDSIVKNSNFLLLSETWLPDGENVDIPDFDCIVQFKRQNVRAAGVAIYQNRNALNITTSHMDVRIQNAREFDVGHTAVGDLCATQIAMVDGRELVMVVVYISPNQKIADIIKFLHRRLIIYSPAGSMLLQEIFHKLPLILAGDFNTNFATEESLPLITFLQTEFQLVMNNHAQDSTTRYGTTIDAVFARYLENIESKTFITYFSYHRPIVTFIESNATVTEITDETSN